MESSLGVRSHDSRILTSFQHQLKIEQNIFYRIPKKMAGSGEERILRASQSPFFYYHGALSRQNGTLFLKFIQLCGNFTNRIRVFGKNHTFRKKSAFLA